MWVKFEKIEQESHFIEVPFYRHKSVGREESRISVLNKILMTQKKTNIFIFLQLVPVPQAKLHIFEKQLVFEKHLQLSKIKSKSHFIEVPFY